MREHRVGDIKAVFEPGQAPAAFDAVVVVLFSAGKLVLVRNDRRAWEFPGGHREDDESFAETAAREVREEVGAEVRDVEYLGYYVSPGGHVTAITRAEAVPLGQLERAGAPVSLFESLPSELSFGDGREQLFVDYIAARAHGRA